MLDLLKTPKAAALSVTNGNGAVSQETPSTIVAVPLSQIMDNPYQPRGSYDPEHILKLATSIKALKSNLPATQGLQQVPLARLVTIQRDGSAEVVARHFYNGGRVQRMIHEERNAVAQLMFGHSRLRALELLCDGLRYTLKHNHIGIQFNSVPDVETTYAELLDPDGDYATMPVVLGFALDHEMWRHAITENSQRKNITAIEEAQSLQRAMDEFGLTTEEAGKPFGYARSTTANKIRLLSLPADVQAKIGAGELTERHGRALLKLAEDPERVRKAAETAIKKGQNVRQLEESVGWEEKALDQEKERARQLASARVAVANGWRTPSGETLTLDRVSDSRDWQIVSFDKDEPKDRLLLEQGGCSTQCECFALIYNEYRAASGYRPDPDNAPHVCLGCLKRNDLVAKRIALGDVTDDSEVAQARLAAAAERKRKIEASNSEARTVWQRWLKDQDRYALWNSIAFWKSAISHGGHWQVANSIGAAPDVQTACVEILQMLYRTTREYSSELDDHVYSVAAVKKLIKALKIDEYAGIQEVVEEGGDDDNE